MTTKYRVSYTVRKVLQSSLKICKVWVTKPNYLVARGPWRLKNWEKIRFGGFEAVRGHIPMRSKVILKAPWVMVLTQPPKKICSIYFCEIGPSFFNFEGPWPPNSLVWWPKSYISLQGLWRAFQRCMTLHISMTYAAGRATWKFWLSLALHQNLNILHLLAPFLEAGGCSKRFLGARCWFGHPLDGFR